ncbi:signal peptide peptidase SppA [Salarchaeum japonicum]|uniref:Peptidase S49 domain-containing protein n=1 Tax=Salarchaeum japonicum TaxID=555573 RepID=A0AAV3T1R3_9EURY|nr:signal peptide peptidase SppA [Salarchaeum japonicum]
MDTAVKRFGRLFVFVLALAVGAAAGWLVFVGAADGSLARLLGIVLAIGVAVAVGRLGANVAGSVFAPYNVAEVGVEGPISRDGGSSVPMQPGSTPADAIVEQMERADADGNVDALVVRLNTPGGEVVPSDDIRNAAEKFEGPTVAYATDTCASGGYWIASGCDRIFARDGSIVGSIGVVGSRPNASGLMEKLGLSYEQFTAGEYKDAGVPLKEMEEKDREYLQGIVDGYYDEFVERVTDGRDLDEDEVRDTEARVYLGEDAKDLGLVDELGTRDAVDDYLESELGTGVETREFEPQRGLASRVRFGAQSLAFAFGAGLANAVGADDIGFEFT